MTNIFYMFCSLFFLPSGPSFSHLYDEPGRVVGYRYEKINPEVSEPFVYKTFNIDHCHVVNGVTVAVGYYPWENGGKPSFESENDWGDRLLFFDGSRNLIYQSRGVGDYYLYEPHFFVSPDSDEVFILCQQAYEYYFGADVFLVRGGTVKYIGCLSVESGIEDDDTPLVEFVSIDRIADRVEFSFPVDTLVLEPASDCIYVDNLGFKYIYVYNDGGELVWSER